MKTVTGLVVALGLLVASGGQAAGDLPWVSTWKEAKRLAQEQHKPVLVDFRADWCPHCRKMEAKVWTDPAVVERAGAVVWLRRDFEQGDQFAQLLGVSVVPWVVLVDAEGKVVKSLRGYQGVPQIRALLDGAAARARDGAPARTPQGSSITDAAPATPPGTGNERSFAKPTAKNETGAPTGATAIRG